jgi:hypothetical protein
LVEVKQHDNELNKCDDLEFCLKKTIDSISEEEIDELNKDKYEEAINSLKKHEDEVRVLRQ